MTQRDDKKKDGIVGTHRLASAVEALLAEKSVTGNRVLVVGVGDGRTSMALLQQGYAVTAVDESPAVLDELRQKVGSNPIDLHAADAADLPGRAAGYDSIISLNELQSRANWRDVVVGWKKVVRPGGLLAFGLHSRENVVARYGADPDHWPPAVRATEDPTNRTEFRARASVSELVDFARIHGMSVRSVTPYAVLGGGNCLIRELEQRSDWGRLVSWFASDDQLLEFGLFLEVFLVAHLAPALAGRILVVLANEADEGQNLAVLQRTDALNAACSVRDLTRLEESLPLRGAELRQALSRLIVPLRPRAVFLRLYEAARLRGIDPGWLLDDHMRDWCEKKYEAIRRDETLDRVFECWRSAPTLARGDADLAASLAYPMAPRVLEALADAMGRKR
jgi:SAM-dependent methyltransferase